MFENSFDEPTRAVLRGHLMRLRVIVCALAAGVLFFQVFILLQKGPPQNKLVLDPLALVGFFMAGAAAMMSFVLPLVMRSIAAKAGGATNPESAATAHQTETILACALLEGAAFTNLIVVMTQNSLVHLLIANALWLLLIARFPLLEESYFRNLERRLRDENVSP